MVTVAELTTRVRALPQTSYAPRRLPSEDKVRKRIASLGIQMGEVTRGAGRGRSRQSALTLNDAKRVVEWFRSRDAARAFDQEFLGFCIEPARGSSDNPIGAVLPWNYRFAPPGVHVDDPGPAHDLRVSMSEVIENFRARNSGDAAALEVLRQEFLARFITLFLARLLILTPFLARPLLAQPLTELFARFPVSAEAFAVAFRVLASDLDSYLMGVVRLIPVPRKLGADADYRLQAFEHLRLVTLPHISEAREPKRYLANAVQSFYRDAIDAAEALLLLDEEERPRIIPLDEEALSRTRLLGQSQEISNADPDPDPHDDDGR